MSEPLDTSQSTSERRYKLRESSKIPHRYRDVNAEEEFSDQNLPYGNSRDRRTRVTSHSSPSVKTEHSPPQSLHSVPIVYPNEDETIHDVRDPEYNYLPEQQEPELPAYRYNATERYGAQGTELSDDLKSNLRKLKNVLKLPKARRSVFCEFFYSGVDQQLFLAENEFSQLMKESFPNLKCTKLRKQEWREVRRLIGKPRRCSQVFLNEERESLETKRQKIRNIYNGTCTSLGQDAYDLPSQLPRPPVVGMKIYARVRSPKDGIYAGTVDAVIGDGYRVVFDKEEMIPPCIIKDYEVMFDQPAELLAINYFIEMNRANIRGTAKLSPMSHLYPTPSFISADVNKNKGVMVMGMPDGNILPTYAIPPKKVSLGKDEKVGNFPVRMLVIMVKLGKVIEYKKQIIQNITSMNDYAEKFNLLTNEYPKEFQFQLSQLVIDMELINKLFKTYLTAIQSYHSTLLPHLNEPQPTDRPENLRKTSNTHAFQIVKHCNNQYNIKNKHVLQVITSLTSSLLQLRTIGYHKKRYTASDLNVISETVKQIRSQILPSNMGTYQDSVEVNMKEIHRLMQQR